MNNKKQQQYKFKLHYLLMRLPYEESIEAWEIVPKLLKISRSTFKRWVFLKEDNHYDIPYSQMVLLANFFNVEPKDIYTNTEKVLEFINQSKNTLKHV